MNYVEGKLVCLCYKISSSSRDRLEVYLNIQFSRPVMDTSPHPGIWSPKHKDLSTSRSSPSYSEPWKGEAALPVSGILPVTKCYSSAVDLTVTALVSLQRMMTHSVMRE